MILLLKLLWLIFGLVGTLIAMDWITHENWQQSVFASLPIWSGFVALMVGYLLMAIALVGEDAVDFYFSNSDSR